MFKRFFRQNRRTALICEQSHYNRTRLGERIEMIKKRGLSLVTNSNKEENV